MELKVKSYLAKDMSKPGYDKTEFEIEFYDSVEDVLKSQFIITGDRYHGQSLLVKEVKGNTITCYIVTMDKKEWFNPKYLQDGVMLYIIGLPFADEV